MISAWDDFLAAVRFLTRVPVPSAPQGGDSLPRAVKFFPLVGALVGSACALVHALLMPHLPRLIDALFAVMFLVLLTGGLHEDGLADAADGFGGGWTRERVLLIMRDSRIGTYGAVTLILSVVARIALISSLPPANVSAYLIAAHVLCRWSTLPLSYFLPSARAAEDGLGAQVAKLASGSTLVWGSFFAFVLVTFLLRGRAPAAIGIALAVTAVSGFYFRRRIRGVTGDCFGATNQIAEIGVYLCGVWIA